MSWQKVTLENTEAVILMQFRDSVSHLKNLPLAEKTAEMEKLGRPYFEKLKHLGHSSKDAIGLLRSAWLSI